VKLTLKPKNFVKARRTFGCVKMSVIENVWRTYRPSLYATLRVIDINESLGKLNPTDETFTLLFLVSENNFLKKSTGTREHTAAIMC